MAVMERDDSITLRPAQRRDAGPIARVVMRAHQSYVARMGIPPAPMRDDYKAVIDKRQVWLAQHGWTLVGVIEVEPARDGLTIHNVAVDPDFQGRGTGRRLLEIADDLARREGCDQVLVYVNEAMVESKVFYEKHGYREYDRHEESGYRRIYLRKTVG